MPQNEAEYPNVHFNWTHILKVTKYCCYYKKIHKDNNQATSIFTIVNEIKNSYIFAISSKLIYKEIQYIFSAL